MSGQHTPAAVGNTHNDRSLRLVPDPAQSSRIFWAASAVNDDTLLRTYIQVAGLKVAEKSMLVQRAIQTAETHLWVEKNRSFQEARKAGVLLFAWYGSSALEGGAL